MSIKFLVLGGGGVFWVLGGGGESADFIFMGARIFLTLSAPSREALFPKNTIQINKLTSLDPLSLDSHRVPVQSKQAPEMGLRTTTVTRKPQGSTDCQVHLEFSHRVPSAPALP